MNLPDLAPLQDAAERLEIPLDSAQLELFGRYLRLIQEHHERAGLTTVVDDDGIQRRHFVEALALLHGLRRHAGVDVTTLTSLIDVGSGAGLPGIPLKIVMPDLKVTLLEATGKKVAFINTVVSELGLKDAVGIHDRAETLAHDASHRETYSLVTARAVAPLATLLELTLPFGQVGGILALPKGSALDSELPASKKALHVLGGQVIDVSTLPESTNLRLLIVKKTGRTPKQYPRRPGVPNKQPL